MRFLGFTAIVVRGGGIYLNCWMEWCDGVTACVGYCLN